MFNFEKLDVWNRSVMFASHIYQVTRTFPADERFGLTNQMRRAAVSIASNIAEGAARRPADNGRMLGLATGSLYEVLTQARIAADEGFLGSDDHTALRHEAETIARMLSGLRRSLG